MSMPLLFDVSGGELIIILLFVLLFFGSKGIPDIARTLGRTMRQVRDASNEVQREIHRGANDVRRTMEEQRRTMMDQEAHPQAPPATPPEPGKDHQETA
jgi:sec-independent protein translocase protein TatA